MGIRKWKANNPYYVNEIPKLCNEFDKYVDRLAKKFWSYVDNSTDPEGCWPWMGAVSGSGYGIFRLGTGRITATRASLLFSTGRFDGPLACHSCDNPICVNPSHLFECTQSENLFDMARKGRDPWSIGSRNTNHAVGVYYDKINDKWRARITINGIKQELGRFDDEESAAIAYKVAYNKAHSEEGLS